MQSSAQLNKKYCVSNNGNSQQAASQQTSSNILCQKCNSYQEQKLVELKKFEARCEVRQDRQGDKLESKYNYYFACSLLYFR